MISRMQLGLILLPFLFLAVFCYVSLKKDVAIRFTPVENEVYRYTTGTVLTDSFIKKSSPWEISPRVIGPLYVSSKGALERAHPTGEKGYTVSLIVISENDRRAIINNAIVGEGDIVDNRKVSRIEKDKVEVTMRGITTWLKLEEE
jgi:hypothetical protein